MRASTHHRLKELGYSSYQQYLNSELWAANKRALQLTHRCWICGSRRALHTHHRSYQNLGREQPGDLLILCAAHHRGLHRLARARKLRLSSAHIVYRDSLKRKPTRGKIRARAQSKTPTSPPKRAGRAGGRRKRKTSK